MHTVGKEDEEGFDVLQDSSPPGCPPKEGAVRLFEGPFHCELRANQDERTCKRIHAVGLLYTFSLTWWQACQTFGRRFAT